MNLSAKYSIIVIEQIDYLLYKEFRMPYVKTLNRNQMMLCSMNHLLIQKVRRA